MPKVGMMTMYRNNYGAFLQAYALQQILLQIGYDVEIINYNARKYRCVCGVELSYLKRSPMIFAKLLFTAIAGRKKEKRKQAQFDTSIADKLRVNSREYTSPSEIKNELPNYDIYLTGSDQMFNPQIRPNALGVRCLDFVDGNNKIKVSYAASVAQSSVSRKDGEKLAELLKDYSAVSVREHSSVDLLQEYCENKIENHMDPTLVLSRKSWEEFAELPDIQEEYILVYKLRGQDELDQYVAQLAKSTKLPIVSCGRDLNVGTLNVRKENGLTPEKFVGRFISAKYVVTNSFHGTAFSLIFHKQARIFVPEMTGIRITELLNMTNLEHLLDTDLLNDDLSEQYKNAFAILDEERKRTVKYLSQWY